MSAYFVTGIILRKTRLKFNPMKQELDYSLKTPATVFLKLTVFGCVLIGLAYASMIALGTVVRAIH